MAGTQVEASEWTAGWRPLAAAFLGVTCGASPIPFNVLPLVMGPIHQEFGWSFAVISLGMTLFGVIGALMAPVFGAMSDRWGVRRVALTSLTAFGVVFASFYFLPNSVIGYAAFWSVLGLIGIGSTPVTFSRAISLWFNKNRGLALGLMLLGTSAAALIAPRIAQAAIDGFGWRSAFPIVALLPLLVALPLGLLWFREPRPHERPAGMAGDDGQLTGMTLRQAASGYRFWVLFASILLIAMAYGGAHIHSAQIVAMHGFSAQTAATALGVIAIGILSGRVLVGLLFDRFWAPGVAFPALLLPAIACWMWMGTDTTLTMIMVGAFLLGFAAGAESDVIAYLVTRYFGMAHYGRIYGVLYMPFGIGSSLSPIAYGAIRDTTGSYDLALMIASILFIVGGSLLLVLGRYPRTLRSQPAAEPQGA